MRQSQLFTKTRKEAPKDEVAKNAQLLIRAGYVYKEMAGVYALLPLGLRVMKNIEAIIRDEINGIGGQEVSLTALQAKSLWEKTNRWDDTVVDNWFKTKLQNGAELGLASTHEEPLTEIMSEYVSSYRDLPRSIYQFQTKFRNEARAKSGVMRGREFLMKDLYSFSRNQEEHVVFYEQAKQAYVRIFKRVGLGEVTYPTFAAGGSFSKFSEEFQTLTSAGEDLIYVDKKKGMALNKEVYTDELIAEMGLRKEDLTEEKAVEVGNIFTLGTRFSKPLGLMYTDEKGEKQDVIMGCYGIGLGRLMGTIVELLSDENGIVWPDAVAPFKAHLIVVDSKTSDDARKEAERLYGVLSEAGIEVLYDDRETRPGEKFADADLMGIPYRIVVSEKTIALGAYEIKRRQTGETEMLAEKELVAKLSN